MLVLADESVDAPIIIAVREAGFDVEAVAETAPSSADDHVLARAASLGAVLITLDRDFGELVFKEGFQPPRAIIYVRSKSMTLASMTRAVLAALRSTSLDGQHVTIDRNQTRRRPLSSNE